MLVLVSALLFSAWKLLGADLVSQCSVKSDSLLGSSFIEGKLSVNYRQISADGYTVISVHYDYIDQTSNEEKKETLFDQLIRGGYDVNYCNPDDRDYSDISKSFSLYSYCTAKPPLQKVVFHASLSKKADGKVNVTAFGNESFERKLIVSSCH